MQNLDWYPARLAARRVWHAGFAQDAAATGTNYGLSAAQVAQIGVDAAVVALLADHNAQADSYAQAYTAFLRQMLRGELNQPAGQPPAPPPPLVLPAGAMAAIEARTRQYARIIRASSGYNRSVGEGYGIVAPERGEIATPFIRSARALSGSRVELKVRKPGYVVAVVDGRRGDGDWEQIAWITTAVWTDPRAPLEPGRPEIREYRCQGFANNARTGGLSDVVSVVTVP